MLTITQTSHGQSCRISFPGFIDDLYQFFNNWTLGARGTFIDPSGGMGGGLDISKMHDRPIRDIAHAAEWRRVNAVFRKLEKGDQDILTAAYTERSWEQFTGAILVFGGGLVGVALLVTDDYDAIVRAFRDKDNSSKRPIIDKTRQEVEKALKRAHKAYLDAEYAQELITPRKSTSARG